MKKILLLACMLASTAQAESHNWTIKIDSILDGTLDTSIAQTYSFNLQMYANKFNGSFFNYPSAHVIQGQLEDKNNQNIGSGVQERIRFSLAQSASVNYYLGKSTSSGYQGT